MAAARAAGCPPFTLIAISGLDWNREMCPWDCPPPFKKSPPCTGGAGAYLRLLTDSILPAAEERLSVPPRWRGIAGYSLAGLFAVFALGGTDLFLRAGSISGSLWFPGIREYLFSHPPKRRPDRLYFSLGDRESKTRNPPALAGRAEHRRTRAVLSGAGDRDGLSAQPRRPRRPPGGAHRGGPVLAPAAVRGERAVSPGGQIFPKKCGSKGADRVRYPVCAFLPSLIKDGKRGAY